MIDFNTLKKLLIGFTIFVAVILFILLASLTPTAQLGPAEYCEKQGGIVPHSPFTSWRCDLPSMQGFERYIIEIDKNGDYYLVAERP